MPTIQILAFILGLASSPPAQNRAVTTVERVDLDRYVGRWYEIARFPNRFQRQCMGDVQATYTRRSDGRIDVVNECRTEGRRHRHRPRHRPRRVDEQTRAKLKVRFAPAFLSFLPFVWGDYWIIGLADDYSWATVAQPRSQVSLDPLAHAAAGRGSARRGTRTRGGQ
jgi:apolipoprotein D and lipocalin family protein